MTALQTTHQTQTAIAAGVFLPLVQQAMQDRAYGTWLQSFRSTPQLVTPPGALAGLLALQLAELTDRDVREAIETELTIAHRCEVTALQPAQVAYPLLAVLFQGDVILSAVNVAPEVRQADPVDVLALGPLTSNQSDALTRLHQAVRKLLYAEAQHNPAALGRCTGEFQALQESARVFPGRAGLLYANTIAANIKLCVRGAR